MTTFYCLRFEAPPTRSLSLSLMLRPTVSRPVCLGLATRFLLLSDSCGFVVVGRSLWREDGSVVYNCWWPSPAQSFSSLSPVVLLTIFYCLRFETSLFVASYYWQSYGGGIRPHLYTGWLILESHNYFTTGGLPQIISSWHQAPSQPGGPGSLLITSRHGSTENTFPVLLLACSLRTLPSNGRCLQSLGLAKGLHAAYSEHRNFLTN
jgi:hypothetical protein